jgi:tetratricopeptide (TPR) repeat protein
MSWVHRLFAALIVVTALTSVARAEEPTPSEEQALQAYRQGSFSKAVQLYTTALTETSDRSHLAQLHVHIAWTQFALGREAEVETHLQAALLQDPSLTLVPDYYTQDFLDLFDKARKKAAESGQQARPEAPPPDLEATVESVKNRLGSNQDLEAALADVNQLIVAYPDDPRLAPLRLGLLRALGRPLDEPLPTHTPGAPGVDPLIAMASVPDLILRANRLLEDNDVSTSLELLREAVSRQPSNVAALELMAEAARRAARWPEAEFALKSALALQPDNISLQLRLGEVSLAMGDASAARDTFRQLVERYPHSDRALASLGLLDARLGARERALDELGRALSENPLLPEVQLAHGELLLLSGQVTDAIVSLRAAANLLRDDPQLEARLGQALLASGSWEEALKHLRAAVAGGFAPADVQRSLALALVQTGSVAEARRVVDAIPPGDGSADTDLVRALALVESGKHAQAEQLLTTLAAGRGNDAKILNLVAVAAYRQGKYGDAVATLKQAHDLRPQEATITANLAAAQAAAAAQQLLDDARPVPVPPAKPH